jgi:hypothetical protein
MVLCLFCFVFCAQPLRRLIVSMDPYSKTSPMAVLHRWNHKINVTVWNETENDDDNNKSSRSDRYLIRQSVFLQKCALTLKTEHRQWTLFTDVDEYILINPRTRDPKDPMYNFGLAQEQQEETSFVSIPSQAEPGSILTLLQRAGFAKKKKNNNTSIYLQHQDNPCLPITRKNFGTKETVIHPPITNNTTTIHHHKMWNMSHFQTHRWRYHSKDLPIGKAMIDLGRVTTSTILNSKSSAHRPISELCSLRNAWASDTQNPFVLYHYNGGTLEQMIFRSTDNRGTKGNGTAYQVQRYETAKTKFHHILSPVVIQDWFDGFVASVGSQEAQRLLQHVGKPYEAAYL